VSTARQRLLSTVLTFAASGRDPVGGATTACRQQPPL